MKEGVLQRKIHYSINVALFSSMAFPRMTLAVSYVSELQNILICTLKVLQKSFKAPLKSWPSKGIVKTNFFQQCGPTKEKGIAPHSQLTAPSSSMAFRPRDLCSQPSLPHLTNGGRVGGSGAVGEEGSSAHQEGRNGSWRLPSGKGTCCLGLFSWLWFPTCLSSSEGMNNLNIFLVLRKS